MGHHRDQGRHHDDEVGNKFNYGGGFGQARPARLSEIRGTLGCLEFFCGSDT